MRCGAAMGAMLGADGGANRKACGGAAITLGRTGCTLCGIGAWA